MRTVSIFGLGVLATLFALPAEALTISNVDPDPHTITITVGSDSKELTIEPQTEVDPPCDSGCKVELESGEQYELKGDESASIEDGVLFVDDAPGAEDDDSAGAGTDPGEPSDSDQGSADSAPPAASPPADAAPKAQ
jgi:hypothetical protein